MEERLSEAQTRERDLQVRTNQLNTDNLRIVQQVDTAFKQCEHFRNMFNAEQRAREQDYQQSTNRIKDLEEQLAEYEEECMKLQGMLFDQKKQSVDTKSQVSRSEISKRNKHEEIEED